LFPTGRALAFAATAFAGRKIAVAQCQIPSETSPQTAKISQGWSRGFCRSITPAL
jgi:hypothetical protein